MNIKDYNKMITRELTAVLSGKSKPKARLTSRRRKLPTLSDSKLSGIG